MLARPRPAGERSGLRWTRGSGLVAQGIRFGLAGGAVTLVYLSATTLLANVAGLPFQLALAIGFCLALTVHFTFQRLFVWTHRGEFALPLHHQARRYLMLAVLQYGITAVCTSLLPSALGVPTETVYLVTVAMVTCVNFVVFRHRIFHAKPAMDDLGVSRRRLESETKA
jgi:putative flippase GtrA